MPETNINREIVSSAQRKHGLNKTYLHRIWAEMRQRCNNPRNESYGHYGGRGIGVCEGLNVLTEFAALMGERPTNKHTLDRTNNDGNYSCGRCTECLANNWPLNVRWADRITQNNNTSRNHFLTANGKTQTVSQWARELDRKVSGLFARIRKGLSDDDVINLPLRHS